MMVTFVSQCQKKALNRTRRVLDAFANRIGDNTWQTVITEDGLIAVKTLLRKTATKNTAVACHWIRSRSRSELVWVVGNRRRFNAEGIVPVNSSQKQIMKNEWENEWVYLPVIQALVALSALFHDWGKSTLLFQNKLISKTPKSDPLRHEWISCLLLNALVHQAGDTDKDWLQLLTNGAFDEEQIKTVISKNDPKPLHSLPPIAQLVGWLIVTHHRLPFLKKDEDRKFLGDKACENMGDMLKIISAGWGYQNDDAFESRVKDCFQFPQGLLSQSGAWKKQITKWSAKLLQEEQQILQLLNNGAYRIVLHHARLCLMLGDHYYSSLNADEKWQTSITLYANTDKQGLKQKLDEHLVHVSRQALKISQSLSRFTTEMDSAYDISKLKQKSPEGFEWQDKAVDTILRFKAKPETNNELNQGWFVVNMASTGCGKTIANAKIMRALSEDGESLRYILALGLRTLTLQTGDEYRNRIGLKNDELAVLIGSAALKELYENAKKQADQEPGNEALGSESLESLLDEDLDFTASPTADFLDAVVRTKKNKAFLYKPVLACTIDHIIAATETKRGGKYILPCLRLLSSDLVIDEVDDFDGKDLIAIGRLIHLAGMLGRKVMISSATIPPAIAEGFFNVYQAGWMLHCQFRQSQTYVACVWVDEFGAQIERLDKMEYLAYCRNYQNAHKNFINKRVKNLQKQIIKRRAYIANCDDLYHKQIDRKTRRQLYYEKIKQLAEALHQDNHIIDTKTGKKVSFGVIRIANIPPCIELTQYLLNADWNNDCEPRIMPYHSRQILLLRHVQEKHLDQVLNRKPSLEKQRQTLENDVIRKHLDNCPSANVLFILVATPVEEVGRDHDFDWAIIEPSSFRSIIQLAGRVRRHRTELAETVNIAILQYNIKALRQDGNPVYCRPGYEGSKKLKLVTADLSQLIDESLLYTGINAIPRIQQPENLRPKEQLVDLEHEVLNHGLKSYTASGPIVLQSWLSENWWMTALPQQFNAFRDSKPEISLYAVWQDDKAIFCEKDERGQLIFIPREELHKIKKEKSLTQEVLNRLWLYRDYETELRTLVKVNDTENDTDKDEAWLMRKYAIRYGEITISHGYGDTGQWMYSDTFGLYQQVRD